MYYSFKLTVPCQITMRQKCYVASRQRLSVCVCLCVYCMCLYKVSKVHKVMLSVIDEVYSKPRVTAQHDILLILDPSGLYFKRKFS